MGGSERGRGSPVLRGRRDPEGRAGVRQVLLEKEDAKECQDVLLVKDASGETTEYDVTKNQVSQESGEACTDKIPATIIGTVSDERRQKWVTASRIYEAPYPIRALAAR